MNIEPHLHCDNDNLPEDHPKAYDALYCNDCTEMLHSSVNEMMQCWVETSKGDFCLECFWDIKCHINPEEEYGWNENNAART